MSGSETHVRVTETPSISSLSGEPDGIREVLERRTADEEAGVERTEERAPPTDRPGARAPVDDAEQVARDLGRWKQQAETATRDAAAERGRRIEAERVAAQSRQNVEDTNFGAVSTALAAAQSEAERLEGEIKTAGENGDFTALAKATTRLGALGAEIRDLERGKQAYEQQRQDRINRPTRTEPEITASDPNERAILQQLNAPNRETFLAGRTPATQAWLREHSEFFTDTGANARIMGADGLARGRGLVPDTKEYFEFIEDQAGMSDTSGNGAGNGSGNGTRQPARREAIPSAAPSRQGQDPGGRQGSGRPGDVVVTKDDEIAAKWLGVDAVGYATERRRLANSGDLPFRRR